MQVDHNCIMPTNQKKKGGKINSEEMKCQPWPSGARAPKGDSFLTFPLQPRPKFSLNVRCFYNERKRCQRLSEEGKDKGLPFYRVTMYKSAYTWSTSPADLGGAFPGHSPQRMPSARREGPRVPWHTGLILKTENSEHIHL